MESEVNTYTIYVPLELTQKQSTPQSTPQSQPQTQPGSQQQILPIFQKIAMSQKQQTNE